MNIFSTPRLLSRWWVGGGGNGDGDDYMLTPTGYPPAPPPPQHSSRHSPQHTAHSQHCGHTALPPGQKTHTHTHTHTQTRRPHSNGLCSRHSEGPDPRSAQRHVNVFVGGQVGKSKQRYPHPNRFPRSKFDTR